MPKDTDCGYCTPANDICVIWGQTLDNLDPSSRARNQWSGNKLFILIRTARIAMDSRKCQIKTEAEDIFSVNMTYFLECMVL